MRSFKYSWKNYGMIQRGVDISEIIVEITTGLKITIDSGGIKIEDEMFNFFQDSGSLNIIDVKEIWEKLDKIEFPAQTEYVESGCDGSAWDLEIDDKKYRGYLCTPPFLKEILKIIKFSAICEYVDNRFSQYIGNVALKHSRKVKDLILYQIATDRHYKIGDKLEVGKDFNYLGERVYNGARLNKITYRDGYNFVDSKKFFANKKLVLEMSKQLEEYDFILREVAFEELRKKEFSDYPSRLKCMFLTDNKDDCLKNLKTFHLKGYGKFFQVVAVKLNGYVFSAPSKNEMSSGLSYNDYYEMARTYWSKYQLLPDLPKDQILFKGNAEIVDIIEEYEYRR